MNVSISSDGLIATATPVVPFPQGAELVLAVTAGVKDLTGIPMAIPFIADFATGGTAVPPGIVIGEVYDDRRSLPLEGATVEALDRTTRQVLAATETDDRGRYLLDPGQIDFVLRISRQGYTSVERTTVDSRGSFAEAMDARLTARGQPQTIQALFGGEVKTTAGDAVVIPPGAFGANASVAVTSISGQGPTAVFPPGWTPLSIIDLEAPEGPPFQATLRFVDRTNMAGGRNATLARYDTASASWLALVEVVAPGDMPVEFSELLEPGQFALVVPDEGEGAPAAVVRGQPLPSGVAGTIPVDAQATGTVNPPVGRVDDPTPAAATIDVTSSTPLRSGTLLRGDFMEVIMLRSGGQVSPLDTSQDFVSYRSLEDSSGRTLVAEFPIAPSRVFNPADVTDGSITVRLSRGLTSARTIIGASGGGVSSADGSRVIAPAGAFAGDVPVELRRLDATTFPLASALNVTFIGGLELSLPGVTAALPLTLSLSGSGSSVATGSTVVVAEVRNVKGVERLVIVALAQIDGSDLTSVTRIGSIETVGVRQSGRYGFYRFDGSLSAVTGAARDDAGRFDGHVTELASLPFVSITTNSGTFVLVSQPGSFQLTATAAANGDQARVSGTTGTPLPEIRIGATPPRVEEIRVRLAPLEGDFAGPVALLGKPAPIVDDDSSGNSVGNGNGQVETNERIELTLFVRNDGTVPIQGGFFVLDVRGSPGVIQVQPASVPLAFLPDDEPFPVGPFVFSVPAGTDPGALRYRLAYANNGGLANVIPFVLPLGVEHPNVPAASEITIRFSEPIVESSLNGGVTLSREDGANIVPENVALAVASDNRSLILRPFTPLASDTVYRITLTSQVVDVDGRSLANAPYVERLRTEDRSPPPLIPADQTEALVPDEDGFITIRGSQGSVNPDDVVIGLNATTGFSALATVNADGSFTVRIRGDATDELSILIRDRYDNTTTVAIGTLLRRDPVTGQVLAVVVGRSGGTVSTQDGIRLIVPAGAVQSGTELAAARLSAPFHLPSDLQTNAAVAAAFDARFTVVDRIRITSNVGRFSGPIKLSVPAPEAAAPADQFVVWRARSVTFGGPLADIDRLTGIPLPDNPIVTADRLEIVESATVKNEGGQLVLSTDSPPFPGITEPGDYTIARVNGSLIYLAGEVRRDTITGPVVPRVVVRSLPDALSTSPFAAVTDNSGRFLVADGSLTGPFEPGVVVSSRLDVFDHKFSRVIRRDVRGTVGPPVPPLTVVAHLEEPFVLPMRVPPEITEILGDLEPPTVEVVIEGPTYLDGLSGVFSPLKVTVQASDNDEVTFIALELDQGAGFAPAVLSPQRTFDITPTINGLLTFRAQARDRSDNSTFENAWVQIGPVISPRPYIVSVDPHVGHRAQSLRVSITGKHTHFAQGISQVGFGPGIAVSGVTITSPTQLAVNVTIAANAAIGARTVAVATDDELVTLRGGFTVAPCRVEPEEGQQGQTLPVTITCRAAHFDEEPLGVNFGADISAVVTAVASATQLTASVAIAPDASLVRRGHRDVTVTTQSETVTEPDGFRVRSRCEAVPGGGQRGQLSVSVRIICRSTHFVQGESMVDFGPGIAVVGTPQVLTSTQLTAVVTIEANAALGARTVAVHTNSETVTLTFNVSDSCSIVPDRGAPGDVLPVTITCSSSNFVERVTTVNFGQGIIAGGIDVVSPLQLRTTLAINTDAQLGERVVNVRTNDELRTILGFTVIPAPSRPFVFLVPPVGYQGQTLLITVSGSNTNFAQGDSHVSFGAGIITSLLTVIDPTTLTLQVAIDFTALVGPRTVSVTTGSETASAQFTVLAVPPPRIACGTFDGTIDAQFWTPINRTTANDQTVRLFDSDGNLLPHSLRFASNDSRIVIVPDQYLRLGATYSVALTDGITDSDGISFPTTIERCEIAPPELIAIIGKSGGENPPRDDVVAINGETVKDVATVGDTVVAVSHPYGSSPGDVGQLHTFQLRFGNNGTFEKIDTLATVPVRGRPQTLATDGATAYVGNRYLGPIATKSPFVSPVVVGAEPLVFPDTMLGCGIEFLAPICVGLSLYWDAFPQPASNLEVFDLGDVRNPNRLGAAVINSVLPDTWDPNTWPNRVEVTPQGIAVHNFLNNVEFFSFGASPTSLGVVGQIKRHGEVTPRGPDGDYHRTADNLENEFLDTALFDGFAVTLVRDGIRIMETSALAAAENSNQLHFESLAGTHGGRLGSVARFQWGGTDGVDTTSDLAFITTTDDTLRIFDVTNPRSPRPMGTLANTFGNMSFDPCRGIAYVHGRLGELHVVDFNDPDHPGELNRSDAAAHIFTVQTPLGHELLGRNVSFNGNTNRDGIVYLVNDAGVPAIRIGVAPAARFDKRRACRLKFLDRNDHELDPAMAALRVSKFVTNQNFDMTDPDNFKVQVVDGSVPGDTVKVNLRSTLISTPSVSELEVTLTRVSGTNKFRSGFLRLVADSVDRDEEPTRTLIVETGGSVEAAYAGTSAAMNVCKPSTIKTVTVGMFIVRHWLTTDLDAAQRDKTAEAAVRGDVARMNQRYAQICMQVQASVAFKDPPTGVNLADGLDVKDSQDPIAAETIRLLNAFATASTDDIQMFWVKEINSPIGTITSGVTIGDTNNIVMSSIRAPLTAAHELGHVLCGGGASLCGGAHTVNPPNWDTPHHPMDANLMYFHGGPWTVPGDPVPRNDVFDKHRRLDATEETTMRSHPLAR
jgi:hypothetical protein